MYRIDRQFTPKYMAEHPIMAVSCSYLLWLVKQRGMFPLEQKAGVQIKFDPSFSLCNPVII